MYLHTNYRHTDGYQILVVVKGQTVQTGELRQTDKLCASQTQIILYFTGMSVERKGLISIMVDPILYCLFKGKKTTRGTNNIY